MGHLTNINETYTEHAGHALWMAWQAAKMAVALPIHAAFPNVLVNFASDTLDDIDRYRRRRAASGSPPSLKDRTT